MAAATCVFVSAVSAPAAADDGRLWLELDGANLNTVGEGGIWGPGLQLGGQWNATDFWAVYADLGTSYHFGDEELGFRDDLVTAVSVGVRYNLDVFTYVPFVGLGVAGYLDTPLVDDGPANTNLGGKIVVGVDWRFDRSWSAGFKAELHALATDLGRYPVYSTIGLNVAWHFRL